MHHIIKKMRTWPAQISVLALSFLVMSAGLFIQNARAVYDYNLYALSELSFSENSRRMKLIEKSLRNPGLLARLNVDDMTLLLRNPSLQRVEADVTAWTYHGDECAIDVYFKNNQARPDYVEYRALTLNDDVQAQFTDADEGYVNRYCLKGVLAAQGVDTPASYAEKRQARPLPSWPSPYSRS